MEDSVEARLIEMQAMRMISYRSRHRHRRKSEPLGEATVWRPAKNLGALPSPCTIDSKRCYSAGLF